MKRPLAGPYLGILGSIIVSEVIFGALASDPRPFRDGTGSLADALADLSLATINQYVRGRSRNQAWINWSGSSPRLPNWQAVPEFL